MATRKSYVVLVAETPMNSAVLWTPMSSRFISSYDVISRSPGIENAVSRAATETRMLFAVLPAAFLYWV